MNYRIKFVYHGKLKAIEASTTMAKEIENIYVALYNEFVNLVNPKFDEWNEEFKRTYPNLGYFDEYEKFIRQKQLTVADSFNRSKSSSVLEKFACHIGIGDENNPILYIPVFGNFESGDFIEFFLFEAN